MTQHVRTGYRKHRRATWAAMLALVGVIAAVVIPLASGASDKTFTIALSSPVCEGGTIVVTIANTAKTQTLGSIEVYFPEGSVSSTTRGTELVDATKDPIHIDSLLLPKGQSTSFTVTLNSGPQSGQVTATGKQSNTFNDTGGSANLFDTPPAQNFSTVTCGTVTGRIYHDRNADGAFTVGNTNIENGDLPKAWTVKVFAKAAGAGSYPSTPSATTTADATGVYSVGVQFGLDYKLCIEAAGSDATKAWGLQSPSSPSICGPISASSNPPATAPGYEFLNLAANATGKDFVVVPVTGILFGAGSSSTIDGYTVTAGSNNPDAKDPARYTQETWTDSAGRVSWRFAPVTPCTVSCTKKFYIFETLTGDVDRPSGGQLELLYDDIAPFEVAGLHPMQYCLIDPRQSGGALATTGVLPPATANDPVPSSCIVEGHQTVIAGGKLRISYGVYSSVDGLRTGH